MARFSRILTGSDSSPATANPPEYVNVESDFVVILAALLCALICTIGLIAVARCAWLRRRAGGGDSASSNTTSSAANKGLKKKVLHSLPKFTYGASSSAVAGVDPCKFASAECAICLGEFNDGEVVRVLPQCGHGFHVGCIDMWLGSHSTCPSCRQILVVAVCRKCGSSDESKGSRVHNVTDNVNVNCAAISTNNDQTSIVINGEFLP